MTWQCDRCNHWTAEGNKHSCINDEVACQERAIGIAKYALKLCKVRLEILTGRMRGCHEETGKHELLDEAQMFCDEAEMYLDEIEGILK